MRSRRAVWWLTIALIGGCAERDRLTFPDNADGLGPVTTIDRPGVPDTVITAGAQFVLSGRTVDADGVDTVYFEVGGINVGFPPISGGGERTVTFGLPIPTVRASGATVVVRIHGLDMLGNVGESVSRQLHIE